MNSSSAAGNSLILGCASTGAKFTPANHRSTGDDLFDAICTGQTIKTSPTAVFEEAEALYEVGCRYYHYHARNPVSFEQTTDNALYQSVSREIQRRCSEMLISFGASRNGGEVRANIAEYGEWERVSQCAMPLHFGGAHFVTIQAAVELQIVCELERQTSTFDIDRIESPGFVDDILGYTASDDRSSVDLETYSTSRGSDYGKTSPRIQFDVFSNAISARNRLELFHEVEWVQLDRSHAMTRFAVEHPHLKLGNSGQLNITLLFGFSPRLPFPKSFAEFKRVVSAAKQLEYDLGDPFTRKRRVSITVGAAVLPQQANEHFLPVDVGPHKGTPMCALRRLVAYASQPESEVDVLRVGMEDTPYSVGEHASIQVTDNVQLVATALDGMASNGAVLETDREVIRDRMGMRQAQRNCSIHQRELPLGSSSPSGEGAGNLSRSPTGKIPIP